MYWIYGRRHRVHGEGPPRRSSRSAPSSPRRTSRAMRAGHVYGESAEIFRATSARSPCQGEPRARRVPQHRRQPGDRLGPHRGARLANLALFYGSYPITPASDAPPRPREASPLRRDDVPGRGRDRGDRIRDRRGFAGARITGTSGPGVALKTEGPRARDHDRAPARHRQRAARWSFDGPPDEDRAERPAARPCGADNGERRCPILAASTAGDCFYLAIEAVASRRST
jgi:2-oxoglutarate ferredoxin oxidoreductase subunit alpha